MFPIINILIFLDLLTLITIYDFAFRLFYNNTLIGGFIFTIIFLSLLNLRITFLFNAFFFGIIMFYFFPRHFFGFFDNKFLFIIS